MARVGRQADGVYEPRGWPVTVGALNAVNRTMWTGDNLPVLRGRDVMECGLRGIF